MSHAEWMLSSIADRINRKASSIEIDSEPLLKHARDAHKEAFKTVQEYDLERALAALVRAQADINEALSELRSHREERRAHLEAAE